jgi:hypothetical protein
VNAATGPDNRDGHKVKVILISQAGAEGVDFKFIRQVHILDPWYNMNRIEQIVGRAVRNFSHKDLVFEKRNVEIFIYGTILEEDEEAADLYVYRLAERKAIQMGKVSRVMKETAVDCLLNIEQTNFTKEKIEEQTDKPVKQILSNGQIIDDFKVGDEPYSAVCDYMDTCDYKCFPNTKIKEKDVKEDTYNESFILMNSEKIFQKIRQLFSDKIDGKFFFKKEDLIKRVNVPKKYPVVQIYAALTQMINDVNEILVDRYGRFGRLINIGEYYLFQPNELSNPAISLEERVVPVDFKHDGVKVDLTLANNKKEQIPQIEEGDEEEKEDKEEINKTMNEFQDNYDLTLSFIDSTDSVPRGDDEWYKHCGVAIRKLTQKGLMPLDICLRFLAEHMVGMLMFDEKLELLNYIYSRERFEEDSLAYKIKQIFDSEIIRTKRLTSLILYSQDKIKVMLLKGKRWTHAEAEDEREISMEVVKKLDFTKYDPNRLIGFIGAEQKGRYLVFKVKDMEAKRNIGARCDEASKVKKVQILTEIMGLDDFAVYTTNPGQKEATTKGLVQAELCSLQELLFRYYQLNKKNNKLWFFGYETAMILKKQLGI